MAQAEGKPQGWEQFGEAVEKDLKEVWTKRDSGGESSAPPALCVV